MTRARDLAAFVSNADGDIKFDTDTLFIDSSTNRVGIGTSSPVHDLQIHKSTGSSQSRIQMTTNESGATGSDGYAVAMETDGRVYHWLYENAFMQFATNNTERMRINNDGVMFFCTDFNPTTAGVRLEVDGDSYFTANGNNGRVIYANRLSSDGDIVQLYKDGTVVGTMGCNSGDMYVGKGDTTLAFADSPDVILPTGTVGATRDNAIKLGNSSNRFSQLFAGTSTIGTSDENEKQQIVSLTDAEIAAAKAISKLFKTFKWNDAVTEKGDNARIHTGVVAQQIKTAMTDNGLDASKYAFYCSDTWWEAEYEVAEEPEELDKEGNVVIKGRAAFTSTKHYYSEDDAPEGATQKTRLGVRYEQLLAFIGAATEQRLTSIEARLTALEAE